MSTVLAVLLMSFWEAGGKDFAHYTPSILDVTPVVGLNGGTPCLGWNWGYPVPAVGELTLTPAENYKVPSPFKLRTNSSVGKDL